MLGVNHKEVRKALNSMCEVYEKSILTLINKFKRIFSPKFNIKKRPEETERKRKTQQRWTVPRKIIKKCQVTNRKPVTITIRNSI